ncbi:MAG: metal ABC transporter substrate-binding protein [Propionibacteriaceae bacterium]
MQRTSCLAAGLIATTLAVTSLAGCSTKSDKTPAQNSDVTIVATTTMLGSVTSSITACAGGTVTTLMPAGTDPHSFAPSSQQVTAMVKAKLVVANGLELEHQMEKVFESAAKDGAKIYEVGPDLDPIAFEHHDHDHEGEHKEGEEKKEEAGHEHTLDPHFWLDPARMATAATKIGDKLAEVTGDATYRDCAAKTSADLQKLDADITATLAGVPKDKRILITDHEAFGYFSTKYGFELAGVAIAGGSTEAETNSENVAELVETIKEKKVPVIFSNTAVSPKLMESIAHEAGTKVSVVALFVDSVGPAGSGAENYTDMMRKNAELIAQSLA